MIIRIHPLQKQGIRGKGEDDDNQTAKDDIYAFIFGQKRADGRTGQGNKITRIDLK